MPRPSRALRRGADAAVRARPSRTSGRTSSRFTRNRTRVARAESPRARMSCGSARAAASSRLWQANTVAARIAAAGGPPCRIVVIKTSGDRLQDAPLSEIGGKRLFVKEIEDALLRGEIDLAVHSSKDMPAVLPDGLAIAGVLPREDPLDAVVLPRRQGRDAHQAISHRPASRTLVAVARPDAVDRHGQRAPHRAAHAAVPGRALRADSRQSRHAPAQARRRRARCAGAGGGRPAAARVRQRGFRSRFRPSACVPAPGQGIVAIEIREDDDGGPRSVVARDRRSGGRGGARRGARARRSAGRRMPDADRRAGVAGRRRPARARRPSSCRSTAAARCAAHASAREPRRRRSARASARSCSRDGAGEILADAQSQSQSSVASRRRD